MKAIVKLNGTALICRQDEDGNYWPIQCRENQLALGLEWNEVENRPASGGFFYGSCIVGPDGNEMAARKRSITYYTAEAGAEIQIVRVELEPHEIQENVNRWRESQRRKAARETRFAFTRAFNAVL